MSAQSHARPHDDQHQEHIDNPDVAHELDDINVRAVLWFAGVLTAIALVIQVAMWGLFRVLQHYERASDPYVTPLAQAAGQPPPEPRLQTTPWTDLRQFRAAQQDYAEGYGWVDEKLGVARIPISRAKELLLQHGIPVRPDLAETGEGTHVAATGESNSGRNIPAGAPDRSTAPGAAPASGTSGGGSAAPGQPAPKKPGGGQ